MTASTIAARRMTPPSTLPKMIHFVLQGDESTTNTTERLLRVEDSVSALVRLQDFGEVTLMGTSANDVGHPSFCTINTRGVLEVLSGVVSRTISTCPIFEQPLTTIVVPLPENVNVPGTLSDPLTTIIPAPGGTVKVGVLIV